MKTKGVEYDIIFLSDDYDHNKEGMAEYHRWYFIAVGLDDYIIYGREPFIVDKYPETITDAAMGFRFAAFEKERAGGSTASLPDYWFQVYREREDKHPIMYTSKSPYKRNAIKEAREKRQNPLKGVMIWISKELSKYSSKL